MNKHKKIAVIGAGIAGLSCAYELQKAGHNVTVFEKESYIGGRMATRTKEGLPFDIGADHLQIGMFISTTGGSKANYPSHMLKMTFIPKQ